MTTATSKQAITSLLTEHLRYTPLTLLDDIINTVNELVYLAVTAVETGLNSASPATLGFSDKAVAERVTPERDNDGVDVFPDAKLEIEHGVHQLETLLEATVDKNFDKLEIYVLRNILSIPEDLAPWIRLSHYDNLAFVSDTNPSTPDSLLSLRRKVHEGQKLHNVLRTESARNAALISQLRRLLYAKSSQTVINSATSTADTSASKISYAFLTSGHGAKALGVAYPGLNISQNDHEGSKMLATHIEQTLAQLPALRSLLIRLRLQLATLRQSNTISLRRTPGEEERRDYVELRARQILEREGVDVEGGEGLAGRGRGAAVKADAVTEAENLRAGLEGAI